MRRFSVGSPVRVLQEAITANFLSHKVQDRLGIRAERLQYASILPLTYIFFSDIPSTKKANLLAIRSLTCEMQATLPELKARLKRLKDRHRRELNKLAKLKKSARRRRRPSEDSLIFSASVVRYEEPYESPLLNLRKLMDNGSKLENNSQNGPWREEETIV